MNQVLDLARRGHHRWIEPMFSVVQEILPGEVGRRMTGDLSILEELSPSHDGFVRRVC